ncbi:MAG: SCO family protein [Hyphomicrobiaceae bacterium]|nr:SCO family protein [Hyphomicrobiaceae bacterium]
MNPRTKILGAALAALVVLAGAGFALLQLRQVQEGGAVYSNLVGGPFKLETQNGDTLSNEDLKGKPFVIFFGFTRCPDVCPTSMLELSHLIERLGPKADHMRYLFVSVDPERDTPQLLKEYLSNFDKRLVGLVGTPQEISDLARAYRVYYEKVPTSSGYTVNHTATLFLMNADGKLASTIAFGEDSDVAFKKLERLVGG